MTRTKDKKLLAPSDEMIGEKKTLFLLDRRLSISIFSIRQWYFKVPKSNRLNGAHYYIINILNKKEAHQMLITVLKWIVSNNSKCFT